MFDIFMKDGIETEGKVPQRGNNYSISAGQGQAGHRHGMGKRRLINRVFYAKDLTLLLKIHLVKFLPFRLIKAPLDEFLVAVDVDMEVLVELQNGAQTSLLFLDGGR